MQEETQKQYTNTHNDLQEELQQEETPVQNEMHHQGIDAQEQNFFGDILDVDPVFEPDVFIPETLPEDWYEEEPSFPWSEEPIMASEEEEDYSYDEAAYEDAEDAFEDLQNALQDGDEEDLSEALEELEDYLNGFDKGDESQDVIENLDADGNGIEDWLEEIYLPADEIVEESSVIDLNGNGINDLYEDYVTDCGFDVDLIW